jgi:nuclear pore complex protein Nup205
MAEDDSLAALQGLHRDLCAHIDLQLPVLERLMVNLEVHLEELKTLLDKKPKNDRSRQTLSSGRIVIVGHRRGTWMTNSARQDHHRRQRV